MNNLDWHPWRTTCISIEQMDERMLSIWKQVEVIGGELFCSMPVDDLYEELIHRAVNTPDANWVLDFLKFIEFSYNREDPIEREQWETLYGDILGGWLSINNIDVVNRLLLPHIGDKRYLLIILRAIDHEIKPEYWDLLEAIYNAYPDINMLDELELGFFFDNLLYIKSEASIQLAHKVFDQLTDINREMICSMFISRDPFNPL